MRLVFWSCMRSSTQVSHASGLTPFMRAVSETRLSRKKFRDNEVRLQLHARAYNMATFLRCIELPEAE